MRALFACWALLATTASAVGSSHEVFPTTEVDLLQDAGVLSARSLSAVVSPLTYFRVVPQRGMRGFYAGGIFSSSTPVACAQQCLNDPLCQSFDFESSTATCYISYTDRYAHPEAFLTFPTGTYYEWQGVVSAPELEPSGGTYTTQISVGLFTQKLNATIHYRIIAASDTNTTNRTTAALFAANETFGTVKSGAVVILPTYSCTLYSIAIKDGMNDSALVSADFRIFASKYIFLVPYFNGDFHGRVVRVQIDVTGTKRPRPALFQEFSDYDTTLGIGPYPTQVAVIDLTTLNPELKGFYGGATAFANTTYLNETYLVFASDNSTTTEWRLTLQARYTPHAFHVGFGTPASVVQPAEYLYLTPYFNGDNYFGTVARVMTSTFNSSSPVIELLNLTAIDPDLKGFGACFADSQFVYFVPFENESGLFGKLVRTAINEFTTAGTTVLDLSASNASFVGFSSAFSYKGYAYMVPYEGPSTPQERTTNLREFPVSNSGTIVRVNLTTFAFAGSIDLTQIHPQLAGFSGAVRVMNYAYFVPFLDVRDAESFQLDPYSGLIARVDLRDFASVQYVNLTQVDADLRGFMRGFAYRQYVFLVPHRSVEYTPGRRGFSGKVARIDTNDFSLTGVSYLDLPTTLRSQVPTLQDDDLRGFKGGAASGKFGHFAPYFNGVDFSGKLCRINLDTFNEVQLVDLTMQDPALAGFSGGIVSKTEEALGIDLFARFQVQVGSETPYEFIY